MKCKFLCALLIGWILAICLPSNGADVDNFVDALNTAWTGTNYNACLTNINARLSGNTNDLPALIAKISYSVFVNTNFAVATNMFFQTDPLVFNLTSSNKVAISNAYSDFREAIMFSVEAVPMTNTPTDEEMQNTRDYAYPTNYPEQRLLRLLGNP